MLKGLVIGIVLGVLVVAGSVWVCFATGRVPVAVTDAPLPFEKRLAQGALNARIDKEGTKESPVPADERAHR